jgi:general secretion pathway protein L
VKENLLIRLGQDVHSPIYWLIHNGEETIASGCLDNSLALDELQDKAKARELIVLLPASHVQNITVKLPTKFSRKLENALPFMLEEELACELDDVLLSLDQPKVIDEQHAIDVAICQRNWFENWLDILKSVELNPTRVLPDAFLLPNFDHADYSAIQLGQNWLFKLSDWRIAEVEPSWLNEFAATLEDKTLAHLSDLDFDYTNAVKEITHYDLPLAVFAKQLAATKFNMLQGDYQVKKQTSGLWRTWQWPAIAAGFALTFGIGIKAITAYQLEQQVSIAKKQATQAYQKAFPGTKVRPNLIRKQIKNKLSQLSSGGETSFLFLLDTLTPIFKEVESFTPESLRFDAKRGELRVRASAKDFQSFNQIKLRLEQGELSVEQGSLNNSGNLVVGELKIKVKS